MLSCNLQASCFAIFHSGSRLNWGFNEKWLWPAQGSFSSADSPKQTRGLGNKVCVGGQGVPPPHLSFFLFLYNKRSTALSSESPRKCFPGGNRWSRATSTLSEGGCLRPGKRKVWKLILFDSLIFFKKGPNVED